MAMTFYTIRHRVWHTVKSQNILSMGTGTDFHMFWKNPIVSKTWDIYDFGWLFWALPQSCIQDEYKSMESVLTN